MHAGFLEADADRLADAALEVLLGLHGYRGAAGAAGVELLSAEAAQAAKAAKVAIDLNAVPPAGIAGIQVTDRAVEALPALLILLMVAGGLIVWVWALIDAIRVKDDDTYRTGTKLMWVLLIALTHALGAVIYLLVGRPRPTTTR